MCKYLKMTLVAVLLAVSALPALASSALETAPDFQLVTVDGTASLNQYRGKIVYLDFWASWCGPCIDSFPWMDAMQKKYADQGVVFLAINLDEKRKDADRFLAANPVSFTVAFDGKGDVAKKYQLMGMPSAYIIGRDGKIRYTHIGFNKGDAAEYESHLKDLLSTK